ncbi:uncharacterized protein LOC141802256 [Halichoeres trimaculatus]|uniref:uncharacterized protein LOC141802256 n=1 Tax=Halichoeres trimaculatus TaxID=147232 RepID=UPI003D9E6C94
MSNSDIDQFPGLSEDFLLKTACTSSGSRRRGACLLCLGEAPPNETALMLHLQELGMTPDPELSISQLRQLVDLAAGESPAEFVQSPGPDILAPPCFEIRPPSRPGQEEKSRQPSGPLPGVFSPIHYFRTIYIGRPPPTQALANSMESIDARLWYLENAAPPVSLLATQAFLPQPAPSCDPSSGTLSAAQHSLATAVPAQPLGGSQASSCRSCGNVGYSASLCPSVPFQSSTPAAFPPMPQPSTPSVHLADAHGHQQMQGCSPPVCLPPAQQELLDPCLAAKPLTSLQGYHRGFG